MVLDNWLGDLPSQFLGKRNIGILISAFAEELDELTAVFRQLKTLTDIDAQSGANLDAIGDIVSIARAEAYSFLRKSKDMVVTDEGYRNVLKFRILQSTSSCTYDDIIHGIELLWGDYSVRYMESDDSPATYILDFGEHLVDDTGVLDKRTMTIHAAGVKALFLITWLTRIDHSGEDGALRDYISRVVFKLKVKHTQAVRTWDGSWILDGTYKLDALAENACRMTYHLSTGGFFDRIYSSRVVDIPGRLKIMSSEIEVVAGEAAVVGFTGNTDTAQVSFVDDGLLISSESGAVVRDAVEWSRISGETEASVNVSEYLRSEKELYAEYMDDGITVCYAGNGLIETEMADVYL